MRHPAHVESTLARLATVLLVSLILGSCAATGGLWTGLPGEGRAERFAQDGEHQDAADIYIALAADSTGLDRDRLTMLAVEQWLDVSRISAKYC